MIQACFVKDDGKLFILLILFIKSPGSYSCVGIQVVKELSHIFCPSSFDNTFGHRQGKCSFQIAV